MATASADDRHMTAPGAGAHEHEQLRRTGQPRSQHAHCVRPRSSQFASTARVVRGEHPVRINRAINGDPGFEFKVRHRNAQRVALRSDT
jgi:hypothetical protein